ncbi:uncharacterized protein ARMOST_06990 [Armillaria ostoyae]|uniref:HTH CENPB-type domain-containing protein n=1 Tax=Armillaria ostoyae TaxID=47428 RepID=A0A284R4I9_ARMOS|nr:uncharacterized protein ARMOST_06990 [Armillaria ostoyae]
MHMYHKEQEKGAGEKKKGLYGVCLEMEELCWKEDWIRIHLDKQTLSKWIKRVKSQARSNAEQSKLTTKEEETLINYALKIACQGFPLDLRQIQDIANKILDACLGDAAKPVEKN